jgi:hypothetical protein
MNLYKLMPAFQLHLILHTTIQEAVVNWMEFMSQHSQRGTRINYTSL